MYAPDIFPYIGFMDSIYLSPGIREKVADEVGGIGVMRGEGGMPAIGCFIASFAPPPENDDQFPKCDFPRRLGIHHMYSCTFGHWFSNSSHFASLRSDLREVHKAPIRNNCVDVRIRTLKRNLFLIWREYITNPWEVRIQLI